MLKYLGAAYLIYLGFWRVQRYFSGSVFIVLGVVMAFSGQNKK